MKTLEGSYSQEGTFEFVEEYKEDDFSRGKLVFTDRESRNEMDYVLEGKGKILTLRNRIFIKEGTKGSGLLNGVYSDSNPYSSVSLSFTGNKFKLVHGSNESVGFYELFETENKEGVSKGILGLTVENTGGKVYGRYTIEGDVLKFNAMSLTKK